MRHPIFSPIKLLDVIIVIILLLLVVLAMWKSHDDPKPSLGAPVQYLEAIDINKISIDRLANDHARLYLLDDDAGILRIFDLDGNYQSTVSFFHYDNGVFFLAVRDDRLYVRDPRGNVYILTDGEFNQFILSNEAQGICKGLDFENNSSQYEVRLASVWRVSEEGDICVIERPLTSLRYQNGVTLTVSVGIIMFFGLLRYFAEKRQRKTD